LIAAYNARCAFGAEGFQGALFALPGAAIVQLIVANAEKCALSLLCFSLIPTAKLCGALVVSVFVGTATLRLDVGMAHDVAQIQVPGSNLRRTLGAIINPHRTMSNAAQAFLNTLAEYADTSPPAYPT